MREAKLHQQYVDGPTGSPAMRIAVKCPLCGGAAVTELQIAKVAEALILEAPIRMHATCHNEWWSATFSERQQIREQLIAWQSS